MLALALISRDHCRMGVQTMLSLTKRSSLAFLCLAHAAVFAQDGPIAESAQLAFEQERWEEAIREYREILAENPEDRLAWLRIAQAQRELGQYETALETLERALENFAPEAMVHVERARNFLGLGRNDEALYELETADHLELRARVLLEEAEEFEPLRDDRRYRQIYANVRARVYPCENIEAAAQFDFWLGTWEVRGTDGALLGYNTITREEGGCVIKEEWQGNPGQSGSSMTFYLPSRGQWRHVWVGSGGTHIDLVGGLTADGDMQMEGTIEYLSEDQVFAFRATWTEGASGLVRQRMDQFDLAAQTFTLWFDGIYRRLD